MMLWSRRHWLIGSGACLLAPTARAWQHDEQRLFGGPVHLWTGPGASAPARRGVLALLGDLHRRWNAWKPGDLTEVNAAFRAGRPIDVDPALRDLLHGAQRLARASSGHFNPAIGALVADWGFHADRLVASPGHVPAPMARVAAWAGRPPSLDAIDVHGLRLDSRDPRVQLDFGGYAKGVALDLALDQLQRAGVADVLLDLGGNVAAMGHAPDSPWRVGLRDPFGPGLVGWVDVQGREAVITSGTYERWRQVAGRRVSHLFDPRSGAPVEALASVTVLHRDAGLADAAATALAAAGPMHWRAVAAGLGVRQVLVIDRHGRQHTTPEMAARLYRA